MTWNRYGSEFTRDRRWDGVPYEARWHYLAVVAECADSERHDCRLPLTLALRASDVPDPAGCHEALVAAGFAEIDGAEFVIIDGEIKHMPPPSLRDRYRKAKQRERQDRHRKKKCADGNHDQHCPSGCPRRVGNGADNALPQNRTEQHRTAPIGDKTDMLNDDSFQGFLPPIEQAE